MGFCPGGTVAGCGFFGDAVIARFDKNHKAPYGIQTSLGLEFQPTKDSALDISFLRSKGVHLGSFFNVNQPDPSGQVTVHNSQDRVAPRTLTSPRRAFRARAAPVRASQLCTRCILKLLRGGTLRGTVCW